MWVAWSCSTPEEQQDYFKRVCLEDYLADGRVNRLEAVSNVMSYSDLGFSPVVEQLQEAINLFEKACKGYKLRLDFDARPRVYVYKETGYNIDSQTGNWVAYADAETMPLAICIATVYVFNKINIREQFL